MPISDPGTYNWTLTVMTDGEICTSSGTVTVAPPPCELTCTGTAAPSTGDAPLTVSFSGTATATNCQELPAFSWTFGDGETSNVQNPDHTYAAAGVYTWTLTVTVENEICTQAGTVTAEEPCVLTCTATAAPVSGVAPLAVSFSGMATAANCQDVPTFSWSLGDGTSTNDQNPDHTYAAPGTYTWTLTAAVEGETCTQMGSITVEDPCTLTCTASAAPVTGDAPLVVSFSGAAAVSNCQGLPLYSWVFGDGVGSSEEDPDHTYPSAGTFTWSLTVTVDGETCTQTGTITVEEPCVLICTASAAPAAGDAPLTVSFTGEATPSNCEGLPVFAWDFGDGATSGGQGLVYTYSTAGTYTWTLTVTVDGETCTQTGTVTVEEPCALTCAASAAPDSGFTPLEVSFAGEATASNCQGLPVFSWTFGDGQTSNGQNPGHTYSTAGTYTWSLTVTVEGETCTQTGVVTVIDPCSLSCEASADPESGLTPLSVSFTGTASASNCQGEPQFTWDFGNGESSGDQNPTHTYTDAGTFSWSLTVTVEDLSCTESGVITVEARTPGDCDGNGAVSIGEVQKSINMHLRMVPASCGADCEGNGQVSIGELQKVINNHLQIRTMC